MEGQLARQRSWLMDHWRYLLDRSVLRDLAPRPRALDIGCGPGLVMASLSDVLDVQGLDHDPSMVRRCKSLDLTCTLGDAGKLPFPDGSFDLVYCSFLLVWVKDPRAVIGEMLRVSRRWVACLAEPDYAARVDYPEELEELTSIVVDGTARAGGDPRIGRRLRSLFSERGIEAEVGVHPGIWSLDRIREESSPEWEWARGMVGEADSARLDRLRGVWDDALEEGTLFQYNPIFYAIARKPDAHTDRLSRQK